MWFPNRRFNQEKNIWNSRWTIQNWATLKSVFSFLWLSVATDNQEILRSKYLLENNLKPKRKEELMWFKDKLYEETNICYEDGIWYFWQAKGVNTCQYLRSFPSSWFNMDNNIWNQQGVIGNILSLKEMFQALWFRIATEEEEKERKKYKSP